MECEDLWRKASPQLHDFYILFFAVILWAAIVNDRFFFLFSPCSRSCEKNIPHILIVEGFFFKAYFSATISYLVIKKK